MDVSDLGIRDRSRFRTFDRFHQTSNSSSQTCRSSTQMVPHRLEDSLSPYRMDNGTSAPQIPNLTTCRFFLVRFSTP